MTSEWAGPLLGLKALTPERVDGELRLRSGRPVWPANLNTLWPKPPAGLAAECPLDLQLLPHGVPGLGCSCGIYASLDMVAGLHEVSVLVRGWGKIALHTAGWRAEHARIEAVMGVDFDPFVSPPAIVNDVAETYGVPVLPWREALELVEPTRLYVEGVLQRKVERLTFPGPPRAARRDGVAITNSALSALRALAPGAAAPPDADPLQGAKRYGGSS